MNITNTTTTSAAAIVWAEDGPDPGAFVWVLITLYLILLFGIAIYSFCRTPVDSSLEGQLKDHFLMNRQVSDVVLMLTIFGTVYSGYTVVGVPEEMYRYGFFSYRWLFTVLPMIVVMTFFGARLNFLSKVRDYISPTDFIADRYNSHILRCVISCTLVYPTIIYVLAQFDSMGSTIEGLSNGRIDGNWGSAVLCVIMLLYEIFGGLRAIAWTDTIQGGVMTIGFFIFYIVQAEVFDGVEAAGNYMEQIPPLRTVLSEDLRTQWFSFGCLLFFAYTFYPQMIQRYQAAPTQNAYRKSMIFLTFGTWLAFTSSLGTGMVAMHYFGAGNPNIGKNEVFGATLRVVMSKGAGWNFFGSVIFTASLAAFMSTADSAINGASCCVSLDLIRPYAKYYKYPIRNLFEPDRQESWNECEMMAISKIVSFIVAVGALLLNAYVDIELGALLQMQNAVLCQVFPAYFLGALTDFVQPYAVFCGLAFGLICTLVTQCNNGMDDCTQAGVDWYWPIERMHPALFGLMINCSIAILFSLLFNFRENAWDQIKPNHEFPKRYIGLDITNTKRPYHFPNIAIWFVFVAISIFAVPWYRGWTDGDTEEFTNGLPQYVRDGYVVSAVCSIIGLISITYFWQGEPEEDSTGPDGATIEFESTAKRGPGTNEHAIDV